MAGRIRSKAEREALEARARDLRARGFSMAEVERETGVPAPTLYQWAARGRWRASDLAEAALREAGGAFENSETPAQPDRAQSRGLPAGAAAGGYGGPSAERSQGEQPPGALARTDPTDVGEDGKKGPGSSPGSSGDLSLSSGPSGPSVLAPGETSSPSLRAGGRPCGPDVPGAFNPQAPNPGHGPVYPGHPFRSGGDTLQPLGMGPPDTPGDDREEGMSADPTTPDALRTEAERCFQAAMALSRRGRMKDADAALKLAERYRALASAAEDEAGGPGAAGSAPDPAKVDAAVHAAVAEVWPRIMGLVKLALKGKVDCLPHWATTKEFLADTLYPDMYYRHPPRSGTPIAGHYGPGPCDALIEEEEEARQAGERADGAR